MHEQWFNLWLYHWYSLLPIDKRNVMSHIMWNLLQFWIIEFFMSTLCILYVNNFTIIYATEYSQLTLSTYREISIINIKKFIATHLNLHCIYKHMFLLKNEWLNGAVVSQLHVCVVKSNSAIFLQYSAFCLFSMFLFTHKFMLLWLW